MVKNCLQLKVVRLNRPKFFCCQSTQDGVLGEMEILNHIGIFTGREGLRTEQATKDEL